MPESSAIQSTIPANKASQDSTNYDVIIIGAGASGLYCAIWAGRRGKKVLVIDHANKAGKKILMSGGGRCNFTNYVVEPEHFVGDNAHFCKSALTRHTNWQFIELVEKHSIAYHEREHGQLFCDESAKDIVTMLLNECQQAGVSILLNTQINRVQVADDATFMISIQKKLKNKDIEKLPHPFERQLACHALVIATGGLSIPSMGASGFGYDIARQFGHRITHTEAGLVPFTFTDDIGKMIASLSGLSLDVVAFNDRIGFARPLLFTHRGLSGPASLQLSNYWQVGEPIHINLLPSLNVEEWLKGCKQDRPKQKVRTLLNEHLPKNLVLAWQAQYWQEFAETDIANIKDDTLSCIAQTLNNWTITPAGTEGYRTAEVTHGGVCTDEVSSKTFESKLQPNLYFIGEVLDVTGWLGGYNFQWAWASGWACGLAV